MPSFTHKARGDNGLDIAPADGKRKSAEELRVTRTFRIKGRVVRELERRAAREDRTLSSYAARVLERHVDLEVGEAA